MASKNSINKDEWRLWYDELASKIQDLSIRTSTSEIHNRPVPADQHETWSDFRAVQDSNAGLGNDVELLIKEVTKLRETSDKLCKNMALVQSENASLRRDLDSLQTENTKLQASVTTQQRDVEKLRQAMNVAQRDVAVLQSENATLRRDLDSLSTENMKPAPAATAQGDAGEMEKLRREMTSLHIENDALQHDVTAVQKYVNNTNQDFNQELSRLSTQIANMTTEMGKPSVAFYTVLANKVALRGQQTVICDNVITNIDDGYASQTGVFTAPASGTYCFMATSTPFSDDVNEWCGLYIMMEGVGIGYLSARGKALSTCHTIVRVDVGHKVWLQAYTMPGHQVNTYSTGTAFTGLSLQ